MSAELIVRSDLPPVTWEEFTTDYPACSIALDGFVSDGPKYQREGPYLNANHHEGVNRLATLSTSQQVLMNIRMGMDKAFSKNGEFCPNVYVNDCDQDVCASWYVLANPDIAKQISHPILNRFIHVAGVMDSTAGAFPYDRSQRVLGELAWIFEPYTQFRASGEMARRDNDQYKSIIFDVADRISQHIQGEGKSIPLDTKYQAVGGGQGWKMIEEQGKDGRVGALLDGIDSYVSVQQIAEDRWRYTIGRRSEFIPFDIPGIVDMLNLAEGNDRDRWGGSDTIAGSPRVGGSKLPPDVVERLINEYLEETRGKG